MRIEVYESDGEAIEAAAALAESLLAGMPGRPAIAVAGGRGGRAIMLALGGRGGIPWQRVRFCVVDEPCGGGEEPSNRGLLREHLLSPRGVAASERTDGDASGAWEAEVREVGGSEGIFDLLVLDLGPRGEIGVLEAEGMGAVDAAATMVRGAARVGLGPAALARARRVIVVATGAQRSQALATAMRAARGAVLPAHLVLPGERVTWIADRAAAAELLRDARPAPA